MKWNTQRKISAGVLGLAIAALVGDQILRASEGQPAADDLVVTSAQREASPVAAAPTPAPQTASARSLSLLAERLETVSVERGLPAFGSADAFSTPVVWLQRIGKQSEATPLVNRADTFRSAHRLSCVLQQSHRPDQSMAVVDGKSIKVGQSFDGFTLVSVSDRGAHFTADGEQVDLLLPRPELSSISN